MGLDSENYQIHQEDVLGKSTRLSRKITSISLSCLALAHPTKSAYFKRLLVTAVAILTIC